ncbi:vacuolar protein [Schizosaccharomyces octosporus yFS286]|uniref:Vacuolar protein n=1 Tax=Schizosaccharomyces octosporus (strain yFS286) TaxID=483514 RepID=S9RE45_SCHOY|nr:vacuolar protein [Schizosaccharomyces octosporus yFS286]EPX72359.1 vacuolar protein [Schizosaccharomyces octosporus yFS286]
MDNLIAHGLTHKLYDKRKSTAYELERVVRQYLEKDETDKVQDVINELADNFIYSPTKGSNAVFGGLIGLAAVAIALGPKIDRYMESIIMPVLYCFNDSDSKIRYYACESMYNIGKVAKGEVFRFFNLMFDVLCKLFADTEITVKNGAELLDRLVKDIVIQQASTYMSSVENLDNFKDKTATSSMQDVPVLSCESSQMQTFSLAKLVPLLSERLYVINPNTRMFLVSWIRLLDSIPDLEFISYLPYLLDGLMNYLSDPNESIRIVTSNCLYDFLREIQRIAKVKYHILQRDEESEPDFFNLMIRRVTSDSEMQEISEYVEGSLKDGSFILEAHIQIDCKKILEIIVNHLGSPVPLIQEKALKWLYEFIYISPKDVLFLISKILENLLPLMSKGENIRQIAKELSQNLVILVSKVMDIEISELDTSQNDKSLSVDFHTLIEVLQKLLSNDNEETRLCSLEWVLLLQRRAGGKLICMHDTIFQTFLLQLSDPSDLVVSRILELLAYIAISHKSENLVPFLKYLLQMFSEDRKFMNSRGNLIIRQLCNHIEGERVYTAFASILEVEENLELASTMVEVLSNNLFTAPELFDLRKKLKQSSLKLQNIFTTLYRAWCHNSVAVFALCLLSQNYEHAANLLTVFAEIEFNVDMLIQLDKLVQLIESPVFTYMRLQLLEPEKYPYLHKALYGILMLLPQSSAFRTLRDRLQCTTVTKSSVLLPNERISRTRRDDPYWSDLLERLRTVQLSHQNNYREPIRATKLALAGALPSVPTATTISTTTSASGITTTASNSKDLIANRFPHAAAAPPGTRKKSK